MVKDGVVKEERKERKEDHVGVSDEKIRRKSLKVCYVKFDGTSAGLGAFGNLQDLPTDPVLSISSVSGFVGLFFE